MGFSYDEFWKITPYQFFCYIEGYNKKQQHTHDIMAIMMYNNAALSQMGKKMPPLNQFLSKKPKEKGIDERHIIDGLRRYQSRYEEALKCR